MLRDATGEKAQGAFMFLKSYEPSHFILKYQCSISEQFHLKMRFYWAKENAIRMYVLITSPALGI